VIVDAAAGFDTVRSSSLISVVSLHATKVFGAGEGGFVVSPTVALRDRIRACSNFGFAGSRIASRRAINSKMSEYHAAVALASFQNWPAARLRHLQIAAWYKRALSALPGVTMQPGYGNGWACGTTNILLQSDSAESIARYLLLEGIETRMWWGKGCHVQPAFSNFDRDELPETDYLGKHVLGLPHFVDMERTDVFRVADILAQALKSRSSGRRR
jgi:dTDP-4-amino-4,6-dideoxygalactose transaminase